METPERSSDSSHLKSPSFNASPLPSSVVRLWRPAAQRNLRNQWSKLSSSRAEWASSSSNGRTHATSLVNAHLSQKYIPSMDLGVLKDMPDIRTKACTKLFKQQELHSSKLLSSYKDMVAAVISMVNSSRSMRFYIKGNANSPIVQFSGSSEDSNDTGDGGGITVFTFWPISYHEQLAVEFVQMFISELNLKRLLIVELLSISNEAQANKLHWSNELYPGEFDDLAVCNLYSKGTCEPVFPMKNKQDMHAMKFKSQQDHDTLQVYLTTWLAEVKIDTHRVNEILAIVGEEMHVNLS